jgi:hypothetical protein
MHASVEIYGSHEVVKHGERAARKIKWSLLSCQPTVNFQQFYTKLRLPM